MRPTRPTKLRPAFRFLYNDFAWTTCLFLHSPASVRCHGEELHSRGVPRHITLSTGLPRNRHEAYTTEDHRYLLAFPCLLSDRKTERKRIDDLYGRIHDSFLGDCWAASPISWVGPGVLGGGTICTDSFTFSWHPTCFLASSPAVGPMNAYVQIRAKGTRKGEIGGCRSVIQDWKLKMEGGGNDVFG
jgi:hypothetical protein